MDGFAMQMHFTLFIHMSYVDILNIWSLFLIN